MGPSYNDFGSSGNAGIVSNAGVPKKNNLKKWLVLAVGILVVVGAVAIGVGIFIRNQEAMKNDLASVDTLLDWVGYTGQCPRVEYEVDNMYTDNEEFAEYVGKCKSDTAELKRVMEAVRGASGNAEYVTVYNNLLNEVNQKVVFGEELDGALKAYAAWHEFLLATDEMDYLQDDEEIEEIAKPLVESGNEVLVKYGEGWATKRKALVDAYFLAKAVNEAPEIESFNALEQDFAAYVQAAPEIDEITALGGEKDYRALSLALYEFNDYVRNNL